MFFQIIITFILTLTTWADGPASPANGFLADKSATSFLKEINKTAGELGMDYVLATAPYPGHDLHAAVLIQSPQIYNWLKIETDSGQKEFRLLRLRPEARINAIENSDILLYSTGALTIIRGQNSALPALLPEQINGNSNTRLIFDTGKKTIFIDVDSTGKVMAIQGERDFPAKTIPEKVFRVSCGQLLAT